MVLPSDVYLEMLAAQECIFAPNFNTRGFSRFSFVLFQLLSQGKKKLKMNKKNMKYFEKKKLVIILLM